MTTVLWVIFIMLVLLALGFFVAGLVLLYQWIWPKKDLKAFEVVPLDSIGTVETTVETAV
jgi:hypothetical protein